MDADMNIPFKQVTIFGIYVTKPSKAANLHVVPSELVFAAPRVFVEVPLKLIRNPRESEIFPSMKKGGMMTKVPKKLTRLKCDNWRGIFILAASS